MMPSRRLDNDIPQGRESSLENVPTIHQLARTDHPVAPVLFHGYTTELLGVVAEQPTDELTGPSELTRLWCDPLTGLVAYPSFAEYLTGCLPAVAPMGVHMAIGDVDNLSEYVVRQRIDDPTMFGHLAGNHCMELVGRVTLGWARSAAAWSSFFVCGTFGGDEVIVASAGGSYDDFLAAIRELSDLITVGAPRTCSFAVGTLAPAPVSPAHAPMAYRQLVSAVDCSLFVHKAEIRQGGRNPRGDLKEAGVITLT